MNLKGYWEFDAQNRADGWNVWVSLAWPFGGELATIAAEAEAGEPHENA